MNKKMYATDWKVIKFIQKHVDEDNELTITPKGIREQCDNILASCTVTDSLKRMVRYGYIYCSPKVGKSKDEVTITLLDYPQEQPKPTILTFCAECGAAIPEGKRKYCSDECRKLGKYHPVRDDLKPTPEELVKLKKWLRHIVHNDGYAGGETKFLLTTRQL